ncbi:hypothetical protein [Lacipirellula parvula]|nr:hypothetical protein [Lacipirellula parvula]
MSRRIVPAFFLSVAALAGTANRAAAQVFDDFSDLNDTANPAWTHLDGLVLSDGQTWDASTGRYRLRGPTNGYTLGANGDLGFVGSYVNSSFTDVKVSADFVEPATASAFGITARIDGNNTFNELRGYGYMYEPFAAGGLGEMVLFKMTGLNLHDMGSQQVTLDLANKDYTFSLEIIGNQLHGKVLEIGGGVVAEKTATDLTNPYTSGHSGLFAYSGSARHAYAEFTVDNFRSEAPSNAIPGDFNGDTLVNNDDLVIWKAAYGQTDVGDANGDNVTDGEDFLIWQRAFGAGAPLASAATAVPEPATLALIMPALLAAGALVRCGTGCLHRS